MLFATTRLSRGLPVTALAALLAGLVPVTPALASPPGTWTPAASMHQSRDRFSGVLLPSGKVLVAGSWLASNSAELYNPTNNTWAVTGSMIQGRSEFKAVLISNGTVLAAGGFTGTFPTAKAEIYNPSTGTWSATGNMTVARCSYVAAPLPNGEILVAGGATAERQLGVTASAEIYNPATGT
ncbi:MAG TPA: kelch repeat-containing protein, partial [Bryobacteraceae bacterium]|nr:kelch repeat-containing protein [Bryobacteraceae bacterium]